MRENELKIRIVELEEKLKKKDKYIKDLKDMELEELLKKKDKYIRELKDRMGFLRKEKVQLQQELDKYNKRNPNSTVIRIEKKKKGPLNLLVKELQAKINKQKIIIKKLKKEKS